MTRAGAIAELLEIMARLRDPKDGCPWDLEQTFATIAPYTIEEAYEVADAIERDNMADLKDELGDLLFQVVFHARMAEEKGAFDFAGVVENLNAKMRRRHPHVFGEAEIADAEAQTRAWEEHKAAERAAKGPAGVLDGVALGLPALTRALKLSKRAGRVGFVWPSIAEVMDKFREEVAELEVEIAKQDKAAIADELGDVLFVCANIARELDIDPEGALRSANAKFTRRFQGVEAALADRGRTPHEATLEEMEDLWQAVKRREKSP